MMEKVIQEQEDSIDNIKRDKQIVYSKWNKLIITSAENQNKKYFNILKYGSALLLLIVGLISLWFAAQWQTSNVLSTIGIDITKWSNYLSTDDTFGNQELIQKISEFKLWDLKGAVLSSAGVQVLVAMGLMMLFSAFPLLIFKNGTSWSIASLALSWVLLIVVIALFALGLVSQSNAIEVNTIPLANQAEIDSINQSINTLKEQINVPGINGILTPGEQLENNFLNNTIINLVEKKNNMLEEFMKTLNDYLVLF